jgi:hypothetical protein
MDYNGCHYEGDLLSVFVGLVCAGSIAEIVIDMTGEGTIFANVFPLQLSKFPML